MSPDIVADLIEALEGEVNNGGFDQFFYNSCKDGRYCEASGGYVPGRHAS